MELKAEKVGVLRGGELDGVDAIFHTALSGNGTLTIVHPQT